MRNFSLLALCATLTFLTGTAKADLPPGPGHDETVNAGTHTIHCGDKYYSHLLVPVIPQS